MVDFSKLLKEKPKPFVSFSGNEVDLSLIQDRSVTLDEYKHVRANSEGFRQLHKKLDNKCLKWVAQHYVSNCRREDSDVTYDYSIKNDIIPELLSRLQ